MWKEIKGFEGYYEVSDDGRVRGMDRYVPNGDKFIHIPQRELKRTLRRSHGAEDDGYLVVNLRKYGKAHVLNVHFLVAQAFIQNPDNKPTINHINGNKQDNRVTNLEWATYHENNTHAYQTGLHDPWGKAILQYDLDGNFIARYPSEAEAARNSTVGHAMISHCANHRAQTAGGYVWVKESEGATTIPQGSSAETDTARSA